MFSISHRRDPQLTISAAGDYTGNVSVTKAGGAFGIVSPPLGPTRRSLLTISLRPLLLVIPPSLDC